MPDAPSHPVDTPAPPRRRGPAGMLLDLFSSIWLGVGLLAVLFIYSSVGSAGVPFGEGVFEYPYLLNPAAWVNVREKIELTEFEWFHWWPFDVIIALICLNLVVATLRRIPFGVINLGVWMIHAGIIVLALGSVWYFSAKLEGDVPVARRVIVASLPGHEPARMVAAPGNAMEIGSGEERFTLQVQSITPDWELLSGDDAGARAYKVSVLVQSPSRQFIRELIAGHPQYTEDLVFSGDQSQPVQRAKKVSPDGDPLVSHELDLALELDAQQYFYLMESAAIALREIDTREMSHAEHGLLPPRHCPVCAAHLQAAPTAPWVQRPVDGLPHFNDYVASRDAVWLPPSMRDLPLRPLAIDVPAVEESDPLPSVTLRITDYLAQASLKTRREGGGSRLDPWVAVELRTTDGRREEFELLALDPRRSSVVNGALQFHWITSADAMENLKDVRLPTLNVSVPASSVQVALPITSTAGDDASHPFEPIEGTPFSYRVKAFQNGLEISGRVVSLAIVEFDDGAERFTRWVFDDPALARDLPPDGNMTAHSSASPLDPRLTATYDPGRVGGLQLVAGPGENELRLLLPGTEGALEERAVTVGRPLELRPGITLTVTDFVARSRPATRPELVPRALRARDIGVQASMVRVHVPDGGAEHSEWLPYHLYPFQNRQHVLRRFPYRPTVLHLSDGRHVEMMLTRARHRLPSPVALEDFQLETHIGGFSGQTSSILDWKSIIVFGADGDRSEPMEAHMNSPAEHEGFWYFQAQWDPPDGPRFEGDPGSRGLNYTVLGVGNREGVLVQLAGCCIAVAGMIYAFYVKPFLKRRRRERVYATVRRAAAPLAANGRSAVPGRADASPQEARS